jgi:hypothetical protein
MVHQELPLERYDFCRKSIVTPERDARICGSLKLPMEAKKILWPKARGFVAKNSNQAVLAWFQTIGWSA